MADERLYWASALLSRQISFWGAEASGTGSSE